MRAIRLLAFERLISLTFSSGGENNHDEQTAN
jgi:hypothetical protein